MCHVVVP